MAGEFSRLTIAGSNMFEAISMTAPIVRSGPTTDAMSSMLMPFCRPTTRPSDASTGLISSQAHRVSYALVTRKTRSKRLTERGDLAEVHRSDGSDGRLLRHADLDAVPTHRLDVVGPLLDERDVQPRADHVRSDP